MAASLHDLNLFYENAATRLIAVDLPPNINMPSSGTLNNVPVQTVIDGAASGGGTDNFFTTSTSDPTGGADGDAHYNSTTQVMWFKIDGTWTRGGTINANEITTGTLAAARIAANSITSDKISVGSLSAISNDAGTITGGTFNGTTIPNLINANVTLSASGVLSGGSGAITSLDYSNVSGTKPDPNATQNFFTTSTSNPTGGAIGDAHFNSATSVMWFFTPVGWSRGGTINAGEITTGTLAAGRIAANSITASKIAANTITGSEIAANTITSNEISVSTLSAITANLGTVNAGNITGSADINITGTARFKGATSSGGTTYGGVFNETGGASHGALGLSSSGIGLWGSSVSGDGVFAQSTTGTALRISGTMTITSSARVPNLYATRALTADSTTFATTSGSTNSVSASNITGSINAATLGSRSSTQYCYRNLCNANGYTAVVGGDAGIRTTGPLFNTVQTRASGNNVFIENKPSDAVTKTNINPQHLGTKFIKDIDAVTFERIGEPGVVLNGFTANQVAAAIGEKNTITSWRENGCMTIDHIALISPIVKAFQEIEERVSCIERNLLNKHE